MGSYSTNEFKSGLKIILENDPYSIVENEMVKPGKGQAFNRVKVRNLKTGRVIERTFKSGDTVESADVVESEMQYLYADGEFWHFMVPDTFEQYTAGKEALGDGAMWLKDGMNCIVMLWNGVPLNVTPPAHVELKSRRDGSGPARRHRDRRRQAGEAGNRCSRARAVVHQRRRVRARRYAHGRVPVARQGLRRVGLKPDLQGQIAFSTSATTRSSPSRSS